MLQWRRTIMFCSIYRRRVGSSYVGRRIRVPSINDGKESTPLIFDFLSRLSGQRIRQRLTVELAEIFTQELK